VSVDQGCHTMPGALKLFLCDIVQLHLCLNIPENTVQLETND
jgi:hypothetical protein